MTASAEFPKTTKRAPSCETLQFEIGKEHAWLGKRRYRSGISTI